MDNGESSSAFKCLNNDLILENIFRYLPVYDLKTTRQISRLWREISEPIIQRKSLIKIENNYTDISALESFLKTFATTPSKKMWFKGFKLSYWNFEEELDAIEAFFEKFGSTLDYLELYGVKIPEAELFRNVVFRWTPILKHLIINQCSYKNSSGKTNAVNPTDFNVQVNCNLHTLAVNTDDEPGDILPISWEEMFLAFPNIKTFLTYNMTTIQISRILSDIQSVRDRYPNVLQIEKVNLFNGDFAQSLISEEIMAQLCQLRLPLKELSIDIGSSSTEHSTLNLLHQYRRHLKKMTLYRGPLGHPMINFPFGLIFPNLRKLEITETVSSSLTFVQFLPNLTSLSICEPPDVEPPFLPSDIVTNTDLNLFKMTNEMPLPLKITNFRIDYDITSRDVKKLVYLLPSVTKAKLYLDDDSFRIVCSEWYKVEELEILGDKLTTEGITGISRNECGLFYNPINIARMKVLRILLINNFNISCKLDDGAITDGFMNMKSLTHLELCSERVSSDGWRLLFNWNQLKVLIPSDGRMSKNSECQKFTKSPYGAICRLNE